MTPDNYDNIEDLEAVEPEITELEPFEEEEITPEILAKGKGKFPGWQVCNPKKHTNFGWIPVDGRGSTRVEVTGKWAPTPAKEPGAEPTYYGPKGRKKDGKYAILFQIGNGRWYKYPGKAFKIPQMPGSMRDLKLRFDGAGRKSANHPEDPIRVNIAYGG